MDTLEVAIKDFEAGAYEQSLTKIAQVLDKNPQNAYAYYYRGMVYDALNKRENAIADYLKVTELAPDIVIANYLLAIDYDTLQKFPEAHKAYTDFVNKYTNEDEYKTYSIKRLEDLKPYATEN
jgi:tetratricopeptide (TPR) repeat protein